MLFEARSHSGIASGRITRTIRVWTRPQAKSGGRYRIHGLGVIEATSVERVRAEALTRRDAVEAGFDDLHELRRALGRWSDKEVRDDTDVYRICFRFLGEARAGGDPQTLDRREVERRLDRIDARSRRGPWTRELLRLIGDHPGTRAVDLAAEIGRERDELKADVRKLKRLGLTESLPAGYRLTDLGRQVDGGSNVASSDVSGPSV